MIDTCACWEAISLGGWGTYELSHTKCGNLSSGELEEDGRTAGRVRRRRQREESQKVAGWLLLCCQEMTGASAMRVVKQTLPVSLDEETLLQYCQRGTCSRHDGLRDNKS